MNKIEIPIKMVPPKGGKVELADPGEMRQTLTQLMRKAGKAIERQAKVNVTSGMPPGKAAPKTLSVRSGALKKSIGYQVFPNEYSMVFGAGGVGPASKYAHVHERDRGRGAMSKPRGKYFLIPLAPYITHAGAHAQPGAGGKVWQNYNFKLYPMKSAGQGGRGSSFDFGGKRPDRIRHKAIAGKRHTVPRKFVRRGPTPPGYVAVEETSGQPWYILKNKVGPMRSRPYLKPTWKFYRPQFEKGLTRRLAEVMDPS